MKYIFNCRRTFIAIFSISALIALGFYTKSTDVAIAISTIAVGLAASNAYEKREKK